MNKQLIRNTVRAKWPPTDRVDALLSVDEPSSDLLAQCSRTELYLALIEKHSECPLVLDLVVRLTDIQNDVKNQSIPNKKDEEA